MPSITILTLLFVTLIFALGQIPVASLASFASALAPGVGIVRLPGLPCHTKGSGFTHPTKRKEISDDNGKIAPST
jgi:hypothetical protein